MRNKNLEWDEGGSYDYYPNELAELSTNNPRLYREIVESNLEENDTVENWENRNLEWAKECLEEQRRSKK